MSHNYERQQRLEPKRMEVAKLAIQRLGFHITESDDTKLVFTYRDAPVTYYPYSGWHAGKSIKDGRGLENLLKQLK